MTEEREERYRYAVILPGELPPKEDLKNDISGFYYELTPRRGFTTAPTDRDAVNQFLHRTAREVCSDSVTARDKARLVFDAFDDLCPEFGAGVFAYCLNPKFKYQDTGTRVQTPVFRQSWKEWSLASEIAQKRSALHGVEIKTERCLGEARKLLDQDERERAEWIASHGTQVHSHSR